MRLPSRLNVTVWDFERLLQRHVKPGNSLLEIGCAPGKLLVWAARVLKARVTGIDYSDIGIGHARRLFETLSVEGDLRCEDVFTAALPEAGFDVVFSVGLIEHFDDPRDIVKRHVAFARPGGVALMVVPNYGGLYGRLQRYFDPENLAIHNLEIMNPASLVALAPPDMPAQVRAYAFGRVAPWIVSLEHRWSLAIAGLTRLTVNAIGLAQPWRIPALTPLLVLEIKRAE